MATEWQSKNIRTRTGMKVHAVLWLRGEWAMTRCGAKAPQSRLTADTVDCVRCANPPSSNVTLADVTALVREHRDAGEVAAALGEGDTP